MIHYNAAVHLRRGNLFLVGLPGSGKSTLGRQLARRLDKTFVDADHELEQRARRHHRDHIRDRGRGRLSRSRGSRARRDRHAHRHRARHRRRRGHPPGQPRAPAGQRHGRLPARRAVDGVAARAQEPSTARCSTRRTSSRASSSSTATAIRCTARSPTTSSTTTARRWRASPPTSRPGGRAARPDDARCAPSPSRSASAAIPSTSAPDCCADAGALVAPLLADAALRHRHQSGGRGALARAAAARRWPPPASRARRSSSPTAKRTRPGRRCTTS